MKRKLTTKQIRQEPEYVDDVKRVRMLEDWREGKATERQRQIVWQILSDMCYSKAHKHYGVPPFKNTSYAVRSGGKDWFNLPDSTHLAYQEHTDRIIQLATFLKASGYSPQYRTVNWCFYAWHRRFALMEEHRQLKAQGVATPPKGSPLLNLNIKLSKLQRAKGGQLTVPEALAAWKEATPNVSITQADGHYKRLLAWSYIQQYRYPVKFEDLPIDT